MEKAELITSLITTGITAISIILIWLIQYFLKKLITNRNKINELDNLADITNYVLEAENKLGQGQGKAKLLYVLQKLGKTEKSKKTIQKINNVHTTLKTAKNIIQNQPDEK